MKTFVGLASSVLRRKPLLIRFIRKTFAFNIILSKIRENHETFSCLIIINFYHLWYCGQSLNIRNILMCSFCMHILECCAVIFHDQENRIFSEKYSRGLKIPDFQKLVRRTKRDQKFQD